jgi:hypothetical protein
MADDDQCIIENGCYSIPIAYFATGAGRRLTDLPKGLN